jgi:hypothetical protein
MSSETTYAGMLGDLGRFTAALEANIAEVPHLQGARERLQTLLAQGQETAQQQAALTAAKQETSRRLRTLVTEGQRVANAVRSMLKEHYGLRSEKLAEFGIQPFRGRAFRTRKGGSKPETPAPEAPAPQPPAPTQAS